MLGALSTQDIHTIQGRRTRPWFLTIAALGGGASGRRAERCADSRDAGGWDLHQGTRGDSDAMTGVPRDAPAAIEPNVA